MNQKQVESESAEALSDYREKLKEEADDIQMQIDHAIAQVKGGGEYRDPQWFAKAKHALRCRRRDIDKLNRVIKEKKREASKKASLSFERNFVNTAYRILDQAQFDLIKDLSLAEMEASQ